MEADARRSRPEGMLCPVCKVDLLLADRQGIEIDYCPQCRGVWLDRGELDKIIERNAAYEASAPSTRTPTAYQAPPVTGGPWGGYAEHHDEHHGDHHRYRRGGFLGGLFHH